MKSSRQKEILQILERDKVVSAAYLAEFFNVSIATIRRDFDQLEKQCALKKTYGGAELRDPPAPAWPSLSLRINSFAEAKQAIAETALQYIPDHCTVALDSGSTTSELCRLLSARKNLIIICSDLHNAELALTSGNRIYMMGGFLTTDGTSNGSFAREFLANLGGVDLFISSTDGADPEDGLTTNEAGINELKRQYLKRAKKTIVLVDSSKFRQKGFYKTCDFSDIDLLITDPATPADIVEKIRSFGTQVIVAAR